MSRDLDFAPQFSKIVRADELRRTREEVGTYHELTIGCPDRHLHDMRMATRVGGTSLIAVQLAGDRPLQPTQTISGQYEISFE